MRQSFSPHIALLRARGCFESKGVHLVQGTEPALEGQLREKATQPNSYHLPLADPDEPTMRRDISRFLYQGHLVHWLVGREDDLAGVIFYKDKPLMQQSTANTPTVSPIYKNELALGLYEGYVSLAWSFMLASLVSRAQRITGYGEPIRGLWARTDPKHQPTAHLFKGFGYEPGSTGMAPGIMTLHPSNILRITGSVQPEDYTNIG
jgi:hypothetical protein